MDNLNKMEIGSPEWIAQQRAVCNAATPSKTKKISSRVAIKHSDGTSHIETYCFGHRWGQAAFPKKYGTTDPKEYRDYCTMVDTIANYEETELSPQAISELKNNHKALCTALPAALDALEAALAENGKLKDALSRPKQDYMDEIVRLTVERDVAVTDLRTLAINDQDCATCKHGKNNLNDCGTYDGPCE